ncbi:hypothetical protein PQI07_16255 [Methylobacterium sp. 092160098-2]|uniref:hypothetical protein n=1 Tax=Methylobacterium sp. 092160098-2 TaxID=3025129 RepID=UPI002381B43D|nr:hypothetical protein [Methylobacterium sp. 092160098-2]MDE4912234.1 hypothetical protein [Methylobacterium sp. 092160098-2]
MSYHLLKGLDGLTGAALRQRLIEARAAALASVAGDESDPMHALVAGIEGHVVRAMRDGVHALVHAMNPPAPEKPAPVAPRPAAPAPRPPIRRVPAPAAAPIPVAPPALRPPTPGPGRLGALRKAPPADEGPPEPPEPAERPAPARPPIPRARPLPRQTESKRPPAIDPADDDIPW